MLNTSIQFGMVSVPVKLYAANESRSVAFNTAHSTCGSRLKQKRWCPTDDREVFQDEVSRVYEWAKDQFIEITDADLDNLRLVSLKTIDLLGFIESGFFTPEWLEKSYYLEPNDGGTKAYALLRETLLSKGVSGIGKLAIRQRERLVAVRASDKCLLLDTLHWPDEVRTLELPAPHDVAISDAELRIASQLVELGRIPFDPNQYHDTYREALLELIEAKKNNVPIELRPKQAPGQKLDLMAALQSSLTQLKAERGTTALPVEQPKRGRAKKGAA